MIICTYEDRSGSLGGLELLILSVASSLPQVAIDITCPNLESQVAEWLRARNLKNVTLRLTKQWSGSGWSVKPGKLLEMLDQGYEEVIWLDTDIVVHRDFRPAIQGLSPETIVIGQEFSTIQREGGKLRAASWGLEYARSLPYTVNSGFIRVTSHHRALLECWQELMSRPEYLTAQSLPFASRPLAMLGDQDVLWALLASSPFAGIPVRYLKCGEEIIQNSGANGYHVVERLKNVWRGLPPLIHFLGKEKPWYFADVPDFRTNRRDYLELVVSELSPYVAVASRFADQLSEPAPWLKPRTLPARLFRSLALHHASLQGLPLALAAMLLEQFGRKPG